MRIALFQNHPECSRQCCEGMIKALTPYYEVKTFGVKDNIHYVLSKASIVAFPGGIGDVTTYDKFFRRRAANAVADFVSNGGKYLGICMGAYWAGSRYFDILDGCDVQQYIKRPDAEIKRPYATVANVKWLGEKEKMFFYDGGVIIANGEEKFRTIARYENGEPMAIIQGNVGLIGCHPESLEYWYTDYKYIKEHWHNERHHKLLLNFVNKLVVTRDAN
jgi:glutamine amidotransferase-like uncharacterized protein